MTEKLSNYIEHIHKIKRMWKTKNYGNLRQPNIVLGYHGSQILLTVCDYKTWDSKLDDIEEEDNFFDTESDAEKSESGSDTESESDSWDDKEENEESEGDKDENEDEDENMDMLEASIRPELNKEDLPKDVSPIITFCYNEKIYAVAKIHVVVKVKKDEKNKKLRKVYKILKTPDIISCKKPNETELHAIKIHNTIKYKLL